MNHTGRVAAQAGFGFFHGGHTTNFYLDRDLVLEMSGIAPELTHANDTPLAAEHWPAHPDGPAIVTAHDRDIALQPDFLSLLFVALPTGYQTLSMNEYAAILHATISASDGPAINFDFDEHYCSYFKEHASQWQLWLADPLKEQFHAAGEKLRITLPPGLGKRSWKP